MVGAVAYPEPGFVIVTDVTLRLETTAVPVARTPPALGNEKATVGTEEYPEPPLVTATLFTDPVAANVDVAVAPLPPPRKS
jgi:hypothetical protein